MIDASFLSRLVLRAFKLSFMVLLAIVNPPASNVALAISPNRFFEGVNAIVIELETDPVNETLFSKDKASESAQAILQNGLLPLRHPISVALSDRNNRVPGPNKLIVLIQVAVRDASDSLARSRKALLATEVTLVRGDLKMPEAIPEWFLIPPEPIISLTDEKEIQHHLRIVLEKQLERGVIRPLKRADSYRQ
jgi:hypothetical protein